MSNPNEPIWFNVDKKEEASADTYQTVKTNKVENNFSNNVPPKETPIVIKNKEIKPIPA